jgi:cyclophilin family peptidyl-prolyl cis-trans isomerase
MLPGGEAEVVRLPQGNYFDYFCIREIINPKHMKKLFLILLILPFMTNMTANAQPKSGASAQVHFVIHTDYGDMTGVLYNETPQHRDNFVKLAKAGYFNGLLFHRVIQGFMIQGGDPDSKNAKPGQALGAGGPGYTIPAEFNPAFIHKKGALSAARQGDQVNPKKASSGSQFYIVQGQKQDPARLGAQYPGKYTSAQLDTYATLGGTPFLDGEYTIFGEITQGLDVIDNIAAVQKDKGDRPVKDIKMTITIK